MPFLRASNGSKVNFSQARLSALISLVYQEAMGSKIPKYRALIQKHCSVIWKELEEVYGYQESDEWPGQGIYKVIEAELRQGSDISVHEAFLGMKINEFQEPHRSNQATARQNKNNGSQTQPVWNKFEGQRQQTLPPTILLHENVDPMWAIVFPKGTFDQSHSTIEYAESNPSTEEGEISSKIFLGRINTQNENQNEDQKKDQNEQHPELNFQTLAQRMGVSVGRDHSKERDRKTDVLLTRRSQWMDFWKEYKSIIPWGVWEKMISNKGLDQRHLTLDEWWVFWQDIIDECLKIDPRIYELRRALHDKQKRALLSNQYWIEGTNLWPKDITFKLDYTSTGQVWYRRLAIEHLKNVFQHLCDQDSSYSMDLWDFSAIHRALKPERDEKISWRAWQHFDEAGSLWLTKQQQWGDGTKSHPDAREMPQWAIMRVCLHLAAVDVVYGNEDKKRCTQNALELYEQISMQRFMPSASVFRDAGKKDPRFFEDMAWFVPDDFSDIQKVIHSNAVDTLWTGTVSSTWQHVRSKNSTVRQGRRRSTGVNDFLKTIDAHMKAQGRMGDERPVTTLLPCWHLDASEFVSLRHEDGQRLQPVFLITDLFMQRMVENGTWTFFDPHIYPEVKEGAEGYLFAEEQIATRKKEHPKAHKTVGMERVWKSLINLMRQGSPYITFEDCDKCYSIQPPSPNNSLETNLIHGLDGVGSFNVFKTDTAQRLEWPSMVVNIGGMISPEGEPLLDEWRETLTWAFWVAEKMYLVCEKNLSEETKELRPLCLGPVGFYEAIQKATAASGHNEQDINIWVGKISEAWGALVTMIDQVFCQKFGPAPIWYVQKEQKNLMFEKQNLETFHPKKAYERLKKQRKGSIGVPLPPEQISELYDEIKAHRYSVRTVWAPFKQLAAWSGVSPGGFGTLFPVEWVMDEKRYWRLTPTNFLMEELQHSKDPVSFGAIFSNPANPAKWPQHVRKMSYPTMEEWKTRLQHAAIVRPWIEQGISLTLPSSLPANQLSMLIQQAWWMGISNIRFEDTFRRPDMGTSNDDD